MISFIIIQNRVSAYQATSTRTCPPAVASTRLDQISHGQEADLMHTSMVLLGLNRVVPRKEEDMVGILRLAGLRFDSNIPSAPLLHI